MLMIMNKRVRRLSTRIVLAGLLLFAVVGGQGQNVQAGKTGGAMVDPTPVTLSMKWARGDPHYGPNFVWLSMPCQASGDVPCECTMQFKVINSQEFADYISSFGDAPVPVVYQVSYGPDGLVHGTRLKSVGSWQADRFQVNDRLLGIGFTLKGGNPEQKRKAKLRNPADCFPPKGD